MLLWVFTLCVGGVAFFLQNKYFLDEMDQVENATVIVISKQEMKLRLIDYKGNELFSAGIACGKNSGNKQRVGDMKTPEGVFKVCDIQDASTWKHNFGDGKGEIERAYGPYFIRLETPKHKGIGIHGTHEPLSIGNRETEGCIRLENSELEKLVSLIKVHTTVIVTPSAADEKMNLNQTLKAK